MNSIFKTGDLYVANSSKGVVVLRVAGIFIEDNKMNIFFADVHHVNNRHVAQVIENGNAAVVNFNESINDMDIIALQDRIFDGGEL